MAEKRFGQHELKTDPMMAGEAIRLWTDVMRVATRAANRLPAIIFSLSDQAEAGGADMADVAALLAVNDILRDTQTDVVLDLLRRIVGAAHVKQASGAYLQADLDQLFTGNMKEIIPVARWVFMEQFADFFPASGDGGILNLFRATLANRK